jgi:hypothetical protein
MSADDGAAVLMVHPGNTATTMLMTGLSGNEM